jgi:hypothetical protein
MFQVDDAVAGVAVETEGGEGAVLGIDAGGMAAGAAAGEFVLFPFALGERMANLP